MTIADLFKQRLGYKEPTKPAAVPHNRTSGVWRL